MKKILLCTIFIVIITLISCDSKSEVENYYEFTGTWKVIEYQYLDERFDQYKEEEGRYIGKEFIFTNDKINILNQEKKNISYRLKVVNKDYILAEEYNLTMDSYLKEGETKDVISIVDNNQIISEFFIDSNNEMILLYKSILFKLNKISDSVDIKKLNNDTGNDEDGVLHEDKEGVMLGIKIPRKLNEDGTYSNDIYKTIWISHEDSEIKNIYIKDDIIFPRMTGIFKMRVNTSYVNDKYIEQFQVAHVESNYPEKRVEEVNTSINQNKFKSIKFIGNDYIAIEKYSGNYFDGNYPMYQIIPVDNINSEIGIEINDIFGEEGKEKYSIDFSEAVDNLDDEEKNELNINNVNYSNITMERSNGKWVLISQITPKINENKGKDFKLSLFPNKKLINYNYLNVSLKSLKSELGYFKDAFTSPEGKIALIQFEDYIAIYKIENGTIIASPLEIIDINEDAEIIMAEWCSSSYVDQWEKVFIDGEEVK